MVELSKNEDDLFLVRLRSRNGVHGMAFKGLNELTRKMDELQKATAALDGDITSVNFDPHDPQSIEIAVQQMEAAIDERVGDYSRNDLVQNLVTQIKEQYRQRILEKAASARAGEGDT